jgi:hypothetical protein
MRRAVLLVLPALVGLGMLGAAYRSAGAVTAPPSRTVATQSVAAVNVRHLGRPVRVLLVGDSLAWESANAFRFALGPNAQLDTMVFPMTAICDWLPGLPKEVETFRPDAVVAEFSGNSFTPCMDDGFGGRLTGVAKVDKYRRDSATAMTMLTKYGATVYWAGAPVFRNHPSGNDGILALYRSMPQRHRLARFIDSGSAITPGGKYTDQLPCSSLDHCAPGQKTVVVRSPDGTHFCPTGMDNRCPVWASGAVRFGFAMAAPVVRDFGL